ncbi:class I SAM-dependent methyltransferase [Aquibium sp. A9E412]|uniref:class I SAM-dependent methyltransferase n=1 Tax=Aquibium sp. A9E412 TaxID=2976767 RepID=UPI0025B264A1|nr:class I SAM-dependent methyltransferase [Aquibium sp. A9E412]MDN2567949.1 class I SAM-dependent methyltransferase [Aquibium sp. A9E412]
MAHGTADSRFSARDERFWDRMARRYARLAVRDAAGYAQTLARTRHWLGAGDRVLEIGCGTGTTALALAPHVGRYLATDISGAMIAIARDKAAAAGSAVVPAFEKATLDDAPGAPGAYDAVLAFNALHLCGDVPAALARVARLVRPGGLFISKTPCLGDVSPVFRLLVPALRLARLAPRVTFVTAAGLERELAAAGFAVVERGRHGSRGRDLRPFLVARRAVS